ncbi:MAG: non-hydrolyzing UDP-N-acetylglucosamine 2-epimerase [Syntrophobacteraceae bacterium]
MIKVLCIAGARPNFMKIAPIRREASKYPQIECKLVHTGQHYDREMSQAFFEDFEIPTPDFHLNVGSASHAVQTAKIMMEFEMVCLQESPDLVMVVGDVNSTLACSLVAKKLQIQVAHVEAGLRSFDLSMPEEINRMVTDVITDFYFVTEDSGVENLLREGKPEERIHLVGNVMVDNLLHQVRKLENEGGAHLSVARTKPEAGDYIFLTLHRPSNVDDASKLLEITGALNDIAAEMPIFFPVHPRTKKMVEAHRINLSKRITLLPPLGFLDALYLWKDACLVLTDSGGLQEETTALGVPCITLRENTERPITIEMGSNILGGTTRESILKAYGKVKANRGRKYEVPPGWDGLASERIWKVLLRGMP